MMLMMQEQAKNRMPVPQGGQTPRGLLNPTDGQKMPVSQQGSMPVMINLQGHGVPPSPEKVRGGPLMVNPQLAGSARRMPVPEGLQGGPPLSSEEVAGMHTMQERSAHEMVQQTGSSAPQMVLNQGPNPHLIKSGPSPVPQHQGASPQQQQQMQPQQAGPMPVSHGLHFPSVPTTSQSSRPKTPNRASPKAYHHPLTPTNRPPSTEPSEISLSPERLNASIAGLFPPKINIPLPPRQPNLNRGFDQQGLNPTTLKAIGQAPPNLTSLTNNNNSGQQTFSTGNSTAAVSGKIDKHPTGGPTKRTSPGNSRRPSPALNRKTTPSPGRQKGPKIALTSPPHQQTIVNPQNVMVNPSHVLSSPAAISPAQLDLQQAQIPLQSIHCNTPEINQVTSVEQRQLVQPQRDSPLSKLTSLHVSQELKVVMEEPARVDASVTEKVQAQVPTQQEPKCNSSLVLREAPTSLNQLLDSSCASTTPLKHTQDSFPEGNQSQGESPRLSMDPETQRNSSTSQSSEIGAPPMPNDPNDPKSKLSPMPSPKFNPNASPNIKINVSPNTTFSSSPNSNVSSSPNPNPTMNPNSGPNSLANVSAVLQRASSSATISPNQITVFVTSNPLSSATTTSHVAPALVSTVVTLPNKNIRSQEGRQTSTPAGANTRPAQFLTTPVFINSIFQVPASSMPPNTNVMSQPGNMVGPIQMSTNIPVAPAVTTAQPSPGNTASSQAGRAVVGQVQRPSSQTTTMSSLPQPPQQLLSGTIKQDSSSTETPVLKSSPVGQPPPRPNPPFSQPLASPPICSSPGTAVSARGSPLSPTAASAKGKPGQDIVSKRGTTGSDPLQKASGPLTQPLEARAQPEQASGSTAPLEAADGNVATAPVKPPTSSVSTPTPVHVPTPSVYSPAAPTKPGPPNASDGSPATATPPDPKGGQNPTTVMEISQPAPQNDAPEVVGLPESSQSAVSVQPEPPQQEGGPTCEKTGDEAATVTEQGLVKKRKTPVSLVSRGAPEKVKGPSRRSSRAEKESEEGATVALEASDNGQRKRTARPGSASSTVATTVKDANTPSPTQAKRRKSK